MRIRHVAINHFRGIRSLDWKVSEGLVCLVGPGDGGKSTILDAIGFALSPRWQLNLSDTDFFECDISKEIKIEVTVGDLSKDVLRDDLESYIRGLGSDGVIIDEPEGDSEPVLTIRLTADSSLEPEWTLVKDALPEPRVVRSGFREKLGLYRIDDHADANLRWSRGSAMVAFVGREDVARASAEAQRSARQAVFGIDSKDLTDSAAAAGKAARDLGSAVFDNPRPGLDPTLSARNMPLVLHDGEIPATRLGMGSKRLASLAFQLGVLDKRAIVLVDEIEGGLEPHRLIHVLRRLRKRADSSQGQIILTTHSPLVVTELKASQLCVVRACESRTDVTQVPEAIEDMCQIDVQATIRSGPSALLANRVVVTEGATELGVCRALVEHWDSISDDAMSLVGTAFRDGNGRNSPYRAICLAELGFPTALLVDNDLAKKKEAAVFNESLISAEAAGVGVIRCSKGLSIEGQIATDLPEAALTDLVALAINENTSEDPQRSVLDAISARLADTPKLTGMDPTEWVTAGTTLDKIRTAIGVAASKSDWFKQETRGIALGRLVVAHLGDLGGTQLGSMINELHSFATGSQMKNG